MHRAKTVWCYYIIGGENFDQDMRDRLTSRGCFHKLAFRVSEHLTKDKEDYYNYILTEYGRI